MSGHEDETLAEAAPTPRQELGSLLGSWLRVEGWTADECEELADEVLRSDWLAARDARVAATARADAWDEGVTWACSEPPDPDTLRRHNPYRAATEDPS